MSERSERTIENERSERTIENGRSAPALSAEEAGPLGAPLVALIHGSMDRGTGMLRLSRVLDHRYRVLRYDRRGYGHSVDHEGKHPGPFDMPAQVADLVELLHGRRAVLVGHSYGGNVALATAEALPAQIAGVAIYETPMSWEPWWPGQTAGAAARADLPAADAAEQFMRRMVGDELWDRLPQRTRDKRRAEGRALVGELRDLAAHQPWHAERIHCPVVLGVGERGAAHHREGMSVLHERFPGSQLFRLAGCRHDAPLSNATLFADVVVGAIAAAAGEPWSTAWSVMTTGGTVTAT